mgnify:CR=1 FL=1
MAADSNRQVKVHGKRSWFSKKRNAPIISQSFNKPFNYVVNAQVMMKALVFEGLTDASWISRPLKAWIEASGIKKHITFHCGRHSYASLLLENGVDIYTIKSLMGHTNVKTTQIYTHIVNEQKEKAANTLHIGNLDL